MNQQVMIKDTSILFVSSLPIHPLKHSRDLFLLSFGMYLFCDLFTDHDCVQVETYIWFHLWFMFERSLRGALAPTSNPTRLWRRHVTMSVRKATTSHLRLLCPIRKARIPSAITAFRRLPAIAMEYPKTFWSARTVKPKVAHCLS